MRKHRKALVVNASPHQGSLTERFCKTFEQAIGEQHTTRLNICRDCPSYSDGKYDKKDTRWQQSVLKSEVLFIGTPVYWFNIPAVLKALLDDWAAIDDRLWQKERFAIIAAYAPEGGEISALNALVIPLNMMGFTFPGNAIVYVRDERKDGWAWEDIKEAAQGVRFE